MGGSRDVLFLCKRLIKYNLEMSVIPSNREFVIKEMDN